MKIKILKASSAEELEKKINELWEDNDYWRLHGSIFVEPRITTVCQFNHEERHTSWFCQAMVKND